MTITAKYNRLVQGLQYYGIDKPTKKRATQKQLKALQKEYQNIRKELKKQDPNIELPTITQAAKYIEEQQRAPKETREPLPYTTEEDEIPQIDFASNIIDHFMQIMNDSIEEAIDIWKNRPDIVNSITDLQIQIQTTVSNLIEQIGEDNLADFINNSLEYDAVLKVHELSYGEFVEVLDSVLYNLTAILNQAKETFIPQSNISLEDI